MALPRVCALLLVSCVLSASLTFVNTDPSVVASFICDRLNDKCKAPAASVDACRAASNQIDGKKNDPNAAVTFNKALGVEATNVGIDFSAGSGAATGGAGAAGAVGKNETAASSAAGSGDEEVDDEADATGNTCGAESDAAAANDAGATATNGTVGAGNSTSVSASNSTSSTMGSGANAGSADTQGGANDLGSCSDPTVKFADGLDGRKEAAFAPVNNADFNHGSALNLKVISDFICQQLQNKCKAGAGAVQKCKDAAGKANALKGQAAADAFNQGVAG